MAAKALVALAAPLISLSGEGYPPLVDPDRLIYLGVFWPSSISLVFLDMVPKAHMPILIIGSLLPKLRPKS